MLGSGFIKNVFNFSGNNTHVRRGEDSPHYKAFDRTAYKSPGKKSAKNLNFPVTDPDYLRKLQDHLSHEHTRRRRQRIRLAVVTTSIALLLFSLIFLDWM